MSIRAEDFLPNFFLENVNWARKELDTLGEGIGVWCIDTGIITKNVQESFANQIQSMPEIPFEAGVVPEQFKEEEISPHSHHVRMNFTKERFARDTHGTIVASIINEVAPQALIYDIKGASQSVRSSDSWLLYALYACLAIKTHFVENDIQNPPIDVVNISLGRYGSDLESYGLRGCLGRCEMANIVNDLSKLGVIVICAAGNSGRRSIACPACSREAVAVGSAIWREGQIIEAEYSSNFPVTNKPDVLAPTEIEITHHIHWSMPGHRKHLTLDSLIEGTSFSAPIVSGVAALLLSKMRFHNDDPRSRAADVKRALTVTARRGRRLRKLLDVKRTAKELLL